VHRCVTGRVVLSSKTTVKKEKVDTFTILLCAALMTAALLLKTPISKRFFKVEQISRKVFHASLLSLILLRVGHHLLSVEQAISGILGKVDDSIICGAYIPKKVHRPQPPSN
jgi:hypothetical protein